MASPVPPFKVLIVDDDYQARRLLTSFVAQDERLVVVGTASSATEAYAAINTSSGQPIDIVMLDINMPDLSGLELARMVAGRVVVIFTTAYSQYALESYDLDAADYLLKPIAPDRFHAAIDKALRRLHIATDDNDTSDKYLNVKADHRIYRIPLAELIYVEGQHEYVTFHVSGRRITALYSLRSLESELPSDRFVRVHRSYIISLNHVSEVSPDSLLVDDTRIPIGGSYRDNLLSRLHVGT